MERIELPESPQFTKSKLEAETLPTEPWLLFRQWFNEALENEKSDPSAMVVSTSDKDGSPSSRVVLLKEIGDRSLSFFTNYESRKGEEITKRPKVALLFYWPETERQIRIEGVCVIADPSVSDHYFASRPLGSQISAIVSPQSKVIASRTELEKAAEEIALKGETSLARPAYWGGYEVFPFKFEFWQGRDNRLHDRFLFQKTPDQRWTISRLAP